MKWKFILPGAGILILATMFVTTRACRPDPAPPPYTVSLDHIKMMRQLHLTRFYFEQIIPVEKKDRLKTIIIVPSTIDAYMDLDELKLDIVDSVNYKFTLPEVRLSEVNFLLDSARVYGFKHFGIYFSDNAYSEAVQDIQDGLKQARVDVQRKAIEQGILEMAYKEGRDFVYNWARSVSEKDISFSEIQN